MQQVGAQAFANAKLVDPRQLPVPLQHPARRALVGISHAWVLHRALILRIFAALFALVCLAGLYQVRDSLTAAAATAMRFVQGEFAQAGFAIKSIEISGQRLSDDNDIIALLTIGTGNSTLTFDVQKAQARLEWLRAVESATVRKVYPNRVIVQIVEREPVVRWRVGDTTWLLDERGVRIGTDIASFTSLPLVIGEGAADDAVAMIRILDRFPDLKTDLAALSRIGDRRWDLIYRNGLRVQLPEQGVAQALTRLRSYQSDYRLLDRDVLEIDLRVAGFIALKPGEAAVEALAEAAKKSKKRTN